MKTKSNPLVIVLVLISWVSFGCNKATQHPVTGQLGAASPQAQAASEQDKKVEQALLGKRVQEQCSQSFSEAYASFNTETEKAKSFLADHADKKLTDDETKTVMDESNKIYGLSQILILELANAGVYACDTKNLVKLSDVRSKAYALFIAIAVKTGKETPESAVARKKNGSSEVPAKEIGLMDQTFKISKELADVLTLEDAKQSVHFVNGAVQKTKEKYDENLKNPDLTVCALIEAPKEKPAENQALSIVDFSTTTLQKKESKVTTLDVHLTSGTQLMQISCRLSSSEKRGTLALEFLKAFGPLFAP